ncbi:MAG: hypothetical protein HY481_00475 [Candidatus Vogelbacteria bacterium]|nr:hypothetical protein [Candidatus Vogelbacteria bacterium]
MLLLIFLLLFPIDKEKTDQFVEMPVAIQTYKVLRQGVAEVAFDLPIELNLEQKTNGVATISLREDIEDILNFTGKINLYRNLEEYQTLVKRPGYIRDPRTAELHLIDRNANYAELFRFADKKTYRGDKILIVSYGDVGGLSVRYLVHLNNPAGSNQPGILVELSKWTYEDPSIWGTMEERRMMQHELLDKLFDNLALTFRFAGVE